MLNNITSFAVALLLISGAINAQDNYLDSTFGNGGIAAAEKFEVRAMALQQDGKILLTGKAGTGTIRRFMPNGLTDNSFGNNGSVTISDIITFVGVLELQNGQILALGQEPATNLMFGGFSRFTFVRLNSDGSINETVKVFQSSTQQNYIKDVPTIMRQAPDGKIVATGIFSQYILSLDITRSGALISRFNPDLTLDTTFAGSGYKRQLMIFPYTALDVLDNGKILAARKNMLDMLVIRINENGTNDTSFGNNGFADIDLGSDNDNIIHMEGLQNDKSLITGIKNNGSQTSLLGRMNANGSLDTTYANNGIYSLLNNSGQNELIVQSLKLVNNKIISGFQGWDAVNGTYDFGLLLTNENGTVETSFGEQGRMLAQMDNNQKLQFILQQPDGKILAAGYDEANTVLMRYDVAQFLGTKTFDKSRFSVYPNPASDKVKVSGLPDGTVMTLYNISGQKLMETVTNGDTQFDISSLPKGMYFLNTAKGSAKIIKK